MAQFEALSRAAQADLCEWDEVGGKKPGNASLYFQQTRAKRAEMCTHWRYLVCRAVGWNLPLHRAVAALPISAVMRDRWVRKALQGGLVLPPRLARSPRRLARSPVADSAVDVGEADESDELSEVEKPVVTALRRSPRGRSSAPTPQPKREDEDEDVKPSRAQLASAVRSSRQRRGRSPTRVRVKREVDASATDSDGVRRSKRLRVKCACSLSPRR